MSDDSNDRLERELDDIFSHPNPQVRMEERRRESEAQEEREHLELLEWLRVQRESDPRYWKGLYESLLAKIERERQDQKRKQDTLLGGIIATGLVAVVLFILDRVL
jgi:hypothetical protein